MSSPDGGRKGDFLPYKAPINKILDHTLVDGPGNRTAVFFQQCNIDCKYCHNQETKNLCRHCGICVGQCPAHALKTENGRVVWDPWVCVNCDTCIRVCPYHSSPKVAEKTVKEVFHAIQANLPFIRGITVSGGECTLYLEFLRELFEKCQKIGLTCLIDSNGTVPLWNTPVMEVCDGVMLDVKAWSAERFHALTGADNRMVKENLRELAKMDKLEEIRIVCLEGWVDAADVIHGIAESVPGRIREKTLLKLIRFRNAGVTGELKEAAMPSLTYMKELQEIAVGCGFRNIRVV